MFYTSVIFFIAVSQIYPFQFFMLFLLFVVVVACLLLAYIFSIFPSDFFFKLTGFHLFVKENQLFSSKIIF